MHRFALAISESILIHGLGVDESNTLVVAHVVTDVVTDVTDIASDYHRLRLIQRAVIFA